MTLEEVETKSGEEDEVCALLIIGLSHMCCLKEVLYSQRSKLFVYGESMLEKGTGNMSWNERGIGEVRLLRHKQHQRIRLLMRQEKTLKVIANHMVDPQLKLEPNVSSDRSWIWKSPDFADGELTDTTFAIRFGDSTIANAFKEKFESCQKEVEQLLKGADHPSESKEVTEAADELAKLGTGDEKERETTEEH